ncbi:CpsD/CapB family tyrosine-protein kinase [Fredinandcohnia sp. SECRCQ15]|uniref:non-specific protein-tyrosine kinase n=1 Tax=Fredinandcohnia quinoae TaxID=2918902 RepID=A0AAW5DZY9_9BACI|nr:CpsD/CapB family tyrosine-protein kinase [Fredinandcohnia sp. SECRCQ15]MCH1624899.1 CpsD/CapB family tyrosine-protein kinase [Fredinandcohnia sp. SECRCQ15]
MIPNIFKPRDIFRKKSLTTMSYPESFIAEQYRTIRTNIQFINGVKKNQSFLITSTNSEEGKSTTAVNLAVSLVQQKERVLLIDTNLKKPSVHMTFNLDNSIGLTDILRGKQSFDDAVVKTEFGRLEVLPSGPIPFNSSELIGSRTMFDLIESTLKRYDIVIFDSPSILESSDTKILANLCDGVILVIKSGKTETKKAIEAKRLLDIAKAKIIGVILNNSK